MGITVAAFVVSKIYSKGDRRVRFITYYITVALINDILCVTSDLCIKNEELRIKIPGMFISLFTLIEITIFFIYIYTNILNRRRKNIVIGILIFFFLFSFFIQFRNHLFYNYYQTISWAFVFESLCLIIPCLLYFFELFTLPKIILQQHPSFWIVTGILFYASCSIPIFLLNDYINKNIPECYNIIFSLNYILYSILFLLFIKGYICRKKVIS